MHLFRPQTVRQLDYVGGGSGVEMDTIRVNSTNRDVYKRQEFTYQLLQGYDFLYQYEKYGVRRQLGGNDQWGNMTTGTELIYRLPW